MTTSSQSGMSRKKQHLMQKRGAADDFTKLANLQINFHLIKQAGILDSLRSAGGAVGDALGSAGGAISDAAGSAKQTLGEMLGHNTVSHGLAGGALGAAGGGIAGLLTDPEEGKSRLIHVLKMMLGGGALGAGAGGLYGKYKGDGDGGVPGGEGPSRPIDGSERGLPAPPGEGKMGPLAPPEGEGMSYPPKSEGENMSYGPKAKEEQTTSPAPKPEKPPMRRARDNLS